MSARQTGFRLLALLSPVLLLALLEIGLRIAGVGYPTSFFVPSRRDGQAVLVDNSKFGWRFFPPMIARTPQPLCLARNKPGGAFRVFLLGESAAMGDPEPSYGLARQLERILRTRHPDKKIEVINAGMTAINSHVIREIAKDCAPLAGDCWIVYAGNNEVIGPFGAGTVFGSQAASVAVVRANLALQSTRTGQLLANLRKRRIEPTEWQGMELFLGQQVRAADPKLQVIYRNFGLNLAAIVHCGQDAGAKVLLSTVAVNLEDCPPFASAHRDGLSASELKEWEAQFAQGNQAEQTGRFTEALAAYDRASRIDSEFAELVFGRACCELAGGSAGAAVADFGRARDLDTLRFRTDARLNQIIRDVGLATGARVIDAEQEFARRIPGRVGEKLFYDHVHLNFTGNYNLAVLLVPEVERALFDSSPPGPVVSEAEIKRQLALTEFDRKRIGEEMRLRLQQPPFASQSNFQERDQRWREDLKILQIPPKDCIPVYRAAVAFEPGDWVLHANFGALLEAAGEAEGATAEWRHVSRLLPHKADAWFHLGNLAYSEGSYAEAEGLFQEAERRDPASPEALSGLGLCAAELGKTNDAVRCFETVLRAHPRYAAARVNLALELSKIGDLPGAEAQYRKTLQLDTNNVAARINLGKLLAGQKEYNEAIALYTTALQIAPGEPVAEHNLGNALVAVGRRREALPHYLAAIKQNPDFVEARYNLGVELGQSGQLQEALDQFAAIVRLKPDFVPGRFNYGITLAKTRRYAEAVRQFEETLKLQPDYGPAKAALERASSLEQGRGTGTPAVRSE